MNIYSTILLKYKWKTLLDGKKLEQWTPGWFQIILLLILNRFDLSIFNREPNKEGCDKDALAMLRILGLQQM